VRKLSRVIFYSREK